MLQDLIIIIGIIFFVYKLITHEGKLSLARIVAMLGMSIWLGVGLLHEVVSIFVLFFLSSVVMGISLIGMSHRARQLFCMTEILSQAVELSRKLRRN